MVTLFIVFMNQALQCFGIRYCDHFNAVELIKLWQVGAVELMFEWTVGNQVIKIYRRTKDRLESFKDRQDRILKDDDKPDTSSS